MNKFLTFGLTAAFAASVTVIGTAQSAKKTITVSGWAGIDKLIEGVKAGFEKENPNLEIKVVGGMGFGDYHPALNNRMQSGNAEDVVAVGGQFVVEYAYGTFLEDLRAAPYNADAKFRRGFVQSQVAGATGPKGNFVAVPADAPPNVMYYRRDLLEKAGVKIEDMIASWDGYIEAGKKLKTVGAFLSNGAEDIAGTIAEANVPSTEGVYFDKAGKSIVDNARFVKAFTYAKQVRDLGLDSRIPGWTPEWFSAFKDGKIATITIGSWFEDVLTGQADKDGKGRWGVSLAPEKAAGIGGGAFYAIPAAGKNKGDAWKFVQYMTSNPKTQAEIFKQSGNFPANLAALKEPIFQEPSAFFGGQKIRQVYVQAAKMIKPALSSKNFDLAATIVGDALKQVLEQNKDIKQALAEAKALIERRTQR